MRIRELLVEFYDPDDDKLGVQSYDDTRRPRLTFHQIQRLRKSKDADMVDRLEHNDFLPLMYGAPEGEEGGPEF